jgi:hypothetical protein
MPKLNHQSLLSVLKAEINAVKTGAAVRVLPRQRLPHLDVRTSILFLQDLWYSILLLFSVDFLLLLF